MSHHLMIAAALPATRRSDHTYGNPDSNNSSDDRCPSSLSFRRNTSHRLFLLLVLAWAMVISLSAGGRAQADEDASGSTTTTTTEVTAIALPPSHVPHLARRQAAPELQVTAWFDQSGPVTAPQLQGKVQLVVFWGVNCPACVKKIPKVREAASRYQDTDLVVIGLHNSQINPNRVAQFVRDRGLNYPIAIDRNATTRSSWGMTTDAYHVRAIPHAAVVDRDGSLKYVGEFEKALRTAESLLKVTSG